MRKSAVIIGYGRMGREHERAYQECGVDVVAAYTAEDNPLNLRLIGTDYVSVCTHDDSHADYILAALEQGCKVIAEKPLCLTEDDLKRIYKLATPETLYCNLPLLEKEWPDGRGSDEVRANYYWGRVDQLPGWRASCPGYSFVLGAGVHMVSLAEMIKGRAIKSVEANGDTARSEIDCDTHIFVSGEFEGGGQFRSEIDCWMRGPHMHRVMYDSDGAYFSITNTKTDKIAGIKRFIEGKYDRYHNSFAAHSVCFAIERALKSGKREEVVYLS